MSNDGSTVCSEAQKVESGMKTAETSKEDESGMIDGQQTSDITQSVDILKDQLRLAKEENESQKHAMEAQMLLFEKEKQAWLSREKELLCKNAESETTPESAAGKEIDQEQKDKLEKLQSSLLAGTEELKSVKDQLQKAQERLIALESGPKDSGSKHTGKKENKGQSDKKQQPKDENTSTEESLRRENEKLRAALNTAVERLKGKTMQAFSMEKQNVQLRAQVTSLKEVTGITKDLLGIRNAEVEHLRGEMDAVEAKVKAEREQRSAAIARVENATQLNAQLKQQYEIQLSTFKQLKCRYEEKVELLSKENRRLVAESNAEGRPCIPLDVGPLVADEEEAPQH